MPVAAAHQLADFVAKELPMRALLINARHVFRALAKRPAYSAISVAVLALAIGANATVFSVLNAFLLRPLPFPDDDRLVVVYDSYPKIGLQVAGTSIPDYLDRKAQAQSLESLAIFTASARTLANEGGAPTQVSVGRASPSLFDVLRVQPMIGRAFTESEATLGNDRVALLSYDFWTNRFGSRPDVVGRELRLDGQTLQIIGVLPRAFTFGVAAAAWTPFAFTPDQTSNSQRGRQFSLSIGRLKPGATLAGLNAELGAIVQRNVEAGIVPRDAIEVAGFTGAAQLLRGFMVGNLDGMLLTLQASVLAVLLIACANVASLQLARVASRRKELAVRAALGAGTARLARLVLLESLALAVVGGILGVALAAAGLELVRALGLERPTQGFVFSLDLPALLFTLGAAVFAALISGLPPVIAFSRDDLTRAVHEAGRLSGGGRGTHALRSALVVAQIGMSVALLVGAGLLTKSFLAMEKEGTGFNPRGLWTAEVELPRARYVQPENWTQFERQALEALRALPGVSAAGFSSSLPFSGSNNQSSMVIDGYVPSAEAAAPHAQSRAVNEQYFAALDIPIVAGRNFNAIETERVAIVDENVADKYWPGGSALGQRVRAATDPEDQWYTIVGVVPRVKQGSLAEDPRKETVYWHYLERPVSGGSFAVRTALPPEQLTRAATAAVAALDPDLALSGAQSMETRVARSMGPQRTPMVLTLLFAGVAFVLAVIGVYGVLNWAVTQRGGEIGVRMALGARAQDVVRMVVAQGTRLLAIGVAIGVAGAIGLGMALQAQIRNVSAVDPAVIALAVAGLAAAALFASWVPARRAARIDPMRALR
ncbi:MAG TPA: ABC transporter permease, partial [Gammaproteobacteria bacterium]|nr:ABC transporter permease [Gammaproteobacteria bacterium]